MNQSRDKMRNKGPKTAAPQARKPEAPVFAYISVCCNAVAAKPALRKTPEAEGTLGSWRCGSCGKPCKCSRTKYKTPEVI
jgi:hypothetical protein